MIRQMLTMALERHGRFEFIGEASDASSARKLTRATKPEVIVLDVGLPGESGLSLARDLIAENPDLRILAVTASRESAAVRHALDTGILGFVSKGEDFEVLTAGLDHLARGEAFYSPQALAMLRHHFPQCADQLSLLTPREREVLRESALGFSIKEISSRLGISENTAKTHRKNVLQKLGLHDVVALTRFAVREGLVSP